MNLTRRTFIASALTAAAGAPAALAALQPAKPAPDQPAKPDAKPPIKKADKPLKILFLGGTVFLGPATVDRLIARGHTVTLFNRGKSNPQLYPDLEKLRGDRASDLKSLEAEVAKGRKWDVVIDTSAYVPKQMREVATVLKDAVGHYVMVASVNVYKSEAEPNQDENAPCHETWPDDAKVSNENYGPMKRGCEVELSKVMPNRWASVRPALIVGPRDPSDRFSYWPIRALRGGDLLAPIGPDEPCSFIDARDIAVLLTAIAEKKSVGPVNAVGMPGMTWGPVMADVLAAAKAAGAPTATLTWVPLSFITANGVQAWSDLPAWVPSADPEYAGAASRSAARALELGITYRPVKDTCTDIYAWWNTLPEARRAKLRAGLTAGRETELLAKFKASKG